MKLHPNPFEQFQLWFSEAEKQIKKYPDAMTLATASPDGIPSARMVLFKGLNDRGLRFFTNYESRKGIELLNNPRAALIFYWSPLDRQIRIEGTVEKTTAEESDQYWNSRHPDSRIGGIASAQSRELTSREELEKRFFELKKKYPAETSIPRPANWGGFCLVPHRFEFWLEGAHRLHDRFLYERDGNQWRQSRLNP